MKRKRGVGRDGARWSYSMICANNINRSMEAHKVVQDAGFRVNSYGAGRHVRIPHEQKGAQMTRHPIGQPMPCSSPRLKPLQCIHKLWVPPSVPRTHLCAALATCCFTRCRDV